MNAKNFAAGAVFFAGVEIDTRWREKRRKRKTIYGVGNLADE